MSRNRLADWEDGVDLPTIIQLRKISQVYRRSLVCFYLRERPGKLTIPHAFRRISTEQERHLSPELVFQIRDIEDRRSAAIELGCSAEQLITPHVGRFTVNDQAQVIAVHATSLLSVPASARASWQGQYDALNGWRAALEQLGILVFQFEDVSVDEARGLAIAELPFPVVAVNGSDAPTARAFSLMHEFCHILVRESHGHTLTTAQDVEAPADPVEVLCNQVAAEILVPRDAFLADPLVRMNPGRHAWTPSEVDQVARRFFRQPRSDRHPALLFPENNEGVA